MEICILSMQHIDNYGSLLQAYSLKKIIENLGHSVSFIDIEKNELDDNLFGENKNTYKREHLKINSFSSKINRHLFKRIVNNIQFDYFRKNKLGISSYNNKKNYDLCVIGSDEVFNCMTEQAWGFTSQLFGNVKQASKVITYAASCGATTYEELPIAVKNKLSEELNKVCAISVRDKNTSEFVKKLTDKTAEMHLDPVVVGDFTGEMIKAGVVKGLPKRFCIVYSYYNRIHKASEINAIKDFCKREDLEIVTAGAPQMWVKKHLALSPFQMLKAFEKADFVITDTFHGTIFSAKYTKKFATIIRESNRNKLTDLLCRLDIENHTLKDFNSLGDVYKVNNDKSKMAEIVANGNSKALDYLKANI